LSLFARLEAALQRLEERQAAARAAQVADRARLAELEAAASDAVKALDTLIGQD
jgi:NADP-dependent 3-hydroxy acid dehydrogenase YdfG